MPDWDSSATAGLEVRGYRRGALTTDSWDQYVIPVKDRIVSFLGRASTFVTPGRAAVGQKILALHNATGSSVFVSVNRIRVDSLHTAAAGKAPTVLPPIIRVYRFTAVPTNGTSLTKVALGDSTTTSNASVTAWGDASGDNAGAGTSSATTLTITPNPANAPLAQAYAPRVMVVGTSASTFYEPMDTIEFFVGEPDVMLRPLEGVVVFLEHATNTTGNPTTDKWLAFVDWEEWTRP
jgi:hypothetical protein